MNVAALVLFGTWFVLIFIVRSIVQKRRTGDSGIRPGAFGDDASSVERFAYLLLVVAFVGAIAAPIAAIVGLDPLVDSSALRAAGLIIAVLGIIATYVSQIGMGNDWRIGIDRTEVTGLVTAGLFALVRNPIFSAMILTSLGFAAMVPNVIAVIAAASLIAAIELQVRCVEEPHLRELHGSAYNTYAARVGRFLPGIGLTAEAS